MGQFPPGSPDGPNKLITIAVRLVYDGRLGHSEPRDGLDSGAW